MRKVVLSLTVVALLCSTAFADEGWFFSHIGPDACVAVENFSMETLQRTYYRGGDMHTPQDVEAAFARKGFQVVTRSDSKPDLHAFNAIADGRSTIIALVKGERLCNYLMSMIPK